MKKSLILSAAFAIALLAPLASALTRPDGAEPVRVTIVGQDAAKEEADAYKAWYDANAAKDYAKAIPLAKAYVEKFPSGQYTKYLKETWLPGMRAFAFNEAIKAKNMDEMIRIAREELSQKPDNLDYIYLVALKLRENEVFANPPSSAHAADTVDFTNKAITLIDGGKTPSANMVKDFNKGATLSWLYQDLAIVEATTKDYDKSLDHYKKSSAADPANAVMNATNFLACGQIHYTVKYRPASEKFSALPKADQDAPDSNPQAKAILDELNKEADAVIDCWAHFMALTATNNPYGNTRSDIGKALAELYKYRHPDAPDGLQKLIDQYGIGGQHSTAAVGSSSSASATRQ
jgi:tetratricopeptide (TPR) repeat protein